jgi:hypothetical protein
MNLNGPRSSVSDVGVQSRWRDTLIAVCALAITDLVLSSRQFSGLCNAVYRCPIRSKGGLGRWSLDQACRELCAAIDLASLHYVRKIHCLHRSAALTCLLRLLAAKPAQLVIGVRRLPFGAHAWVEVQGAIVSDFSTVIRGYREVARF